ncbi:MAG TPA: type I methionyl aminopeptidase [Pyrinomonadaceae bacterium]|jgi:methionyl aminopeptidase|nr:type I methionyl aminopeptidase [Pyrinomonadaceae bacterium]
MIIGKSQKEIDKMRASGQLVGRVLQELRAMAAPGITTLEVDRAAEKMIRDGGALPTFKGYNGFPFSICASVNDQVVHGFPSQYELKEGDIFSIDVGATLDGFVGDTATTVPVGRVSEDRLRLLRVTEECLQLAIEQCRAGNHLGDIGFAVQSHAEALGYSIVRDYVGHGIGRQMHEDPQIPNYGKPGKGPKIKKGYVFALEPMVNMGSLHTKTLKDGWTVVTVDGQPSAHFEHTVAITEEGPEVLTKVRSTAAELVTAA